jgi:predicted nucleic acid-binding Zn ribbon protein
MTTLCFECDAASDPTGAASTALTVDGSGFWVTDHRGRETVYV